MAGVPKTPAAGAGEQILWSMLGGREHLHDIADYEAAGGYVQLAAARQRTGDELIGDIKASGIRGRGGAGFPTGLKMSFIPKDVPKPKYVVCNADESEPCTFKDRELIERLPHLLVEGCMIAAHAIGAEAAMIYIRGEYLEPFEVLRDAAEQARAKGYLGVDGLPALVIHRGAGAYICGEETALLSSLNGFRGQPTVKPPFPAVSGLYKSPTLVNNVETLATLPRILEVGGDVYGKIGVVAPGPASGTGTRIMSLSGHVNRPGNYELTIGTPLRSLIEEHGGGVPEGRAIKAVIPGGSSTPVLTPEEAMSANLDYQSMADLRTMFGSGSVIVVDERTCMAQLGLRVAEFYKHESCGKCTPCREGTKWTVDLLTRLVAGGGQPGDVDLIDDVCRRIMGNCLCPLGDAMAMPVRSYIAKFRSDFDRYLEPGFVPPPESPMRVIAEMAVAHHEHVKPGATWVGSLKRSAPAAAKAGA